MTAKLHYDWFKQEASTKVNASLTLSAQELIFEIKMSGSTLFHPQSTFSTYQEELWKYDLVECFLAAPNQSNAGKNTPYLEINLNPKGAWWIMSFDQIRKPSPWFQKNKASKNITITQSGSTTLMHLNRRFLEEILQTKLENAHYNLTAIVDSVFKQKFLTHAPLPGKTPDFHQPQFFLPFK